MIACIGGAHIDRRGVVQGPVVLGTSNPARVFTDFGGVARNVADNLRRLGCEVMLASRLGPDENGRAVLEHAAAAGIDVSLCTVSASSPTASYTAILDHHGELVIGLADMAIYEEITPAVLEAALARLRCAGLWFLDANLPAGTMEWLLSAAGTIPVAVDCISVAKAERVAPVLSRIPLVFGNLAQAAVLAAQPFIESTREAAMALRALGARAGIVTAGRSPIAVWTGEEIHTFRPLTAAPRDVTGAGDALVSGVLYGLSRGRRLPEAAELGLAAAAITVESEHATAPDLSPALLEARRA